MSEESTGAKRKRSEALEQAKQWQTRRRERTSTKGKAEEQASEQKKAEIQENPFFKIITDESLSLEEKQKAIAEAAAYNVKMSEEQNAEQLAALQEFAEYLMEERQAQAEKIIELHDTETFGELQRVFEDMNESLRDFEEQIYPLVEIIEAVNKLNMASDGAMYGVYKEIKEDEAEEARIAQLREDKKNEILRYKQDLKDIDGDVAALKSKKRLFGMLGPSSEDLEAAARKEASKKDIYDDIRAAETEIENATVNRETEFAEFAHEKQKLRELLDLSGEEHKGRQEMLVQAALTYVRNMKERSGAVLDRMEYVSDQIEDADTTNGKLSKIFAVVNDGVKDAEAINKGLTQQFEEAPEGESSVKRIIREEKLRGIKGHVETTTAAKLDTLETLSELSKESRDIRSMMETNTRQIAKTRKLHSSGTAGVASRLSVVMTAVNGAALNESSSTLENTLGEMNRITGDIAGMEAIKNATNLALQNDALAKAVEELNAYREISDEATAITRENLEEQKKLQEEIEQAARNLSESVKKAKGVTADVMQDGELGSDAAEEQDNKRPSNRPDIGKLDI